MKYLARAAHDCDLETVATAIEVFGAQDVRVRNGSGVIAFEADEEVAESIRQLNSVRSVDADESDDRGLGPCGRADAYGMR